MGSPHPADRVNICQLAEQAFARIFLSSEVAIEMEDPRYKVAAIEMEDSRCTGLQNGMDIQVEDFRCERLPNRAAIPAEDPRCAHLVVATEDPRCQWLHMNW